jgi:hypothetical protein
MQTKDDSVWCNAMEHEGQIRRVTVCHGNRSECAAKPFLVQDTVILPNPQFYLIPWSVCVCHGNRSECAAKPFLVQDTVILPNPQFYLIPWSFWVCLKLYLQVYSSVLLWFLCSCRWEVNLQDLSIAVMRNIKPWVLKKRSEIIRIKCLRIVSSSVLILFVTQTYIDHSLGLRHLISMHEYVATIGYSFMCVTVVYLTWRTSEY